MKKIIGFCFFLVLINSASAIQDINITLDSSSVEMCIAFGNISNYVCGGNQSISIDGTRDYDYYVLPMQMKPLTVHNLANDSSYMQDILTLPGFTLLAVFTLFIPLGFGGLIVYGIITMVFPKRG
jgi:hypothetical protein